MVEKISIVSQDACGQYDEDGNQITHWDEKKCAWIVNKEYEDADIDWWGEDNDFPAGCTEAEYIADHPNWDKMPDIEVIWTWDEEGYKRAFPDWNRFDLKLPEFPTSCVRSWGYLDYTKEDAIEHLGRYCKFNVFAVNTRIRYNGEDIFNGKLD